LRSINLNNKLHKIKSFLLNPSSQSIGIRILSDAKGGELEQIINFYPKQIRYCKNDPFQFADPFLYYDDSKGFYCFYEIKSKSKPGMIKALNLESMLEIDVDLPSGVHYSFPFVIKHNKQIYLIPETAELKEVSLYIEECFPVKWKKLVVLLTGDYVDSHIKEHSGVYYLYTTLKDNGQYIMKLFHSTKIECPYIEHVKSPLQLS
jgi:hypothetical protein